MKLLILDSGHAEYVVGKCSPCKTFYEWSFNDDIQRKIKKRAMEHGVEVFLTNPSPAKKDEIGLTKRTELANSYWVSKGRPATIMISLHANAYGSDFNSARGTETFVASNASSTSKNFAKILNDEVVKTMQMLDNGSRDRGVKTNDFTVIYKSNMPTCLVEYGFYTNSSDLKILKNNRAELVEATVRAVCKHFGIAYKEPVVAKPPTSPSDGTLWAVCVGAYRDKSMADEIVEELKKKGYTSSYLIPR